MKLKKPSSKILSLLLVFIAIYIIFAIVFNQFKDIWWDEAAYIGFGKYLFSHGQLGIFEYMRPPFFPLILGLAWKIGLNPAIFGKLFILSLSLLSLYITYLISKEFLNDKTAIISTIILFSNALFFLFMFRIYTEMLSLLTILLAIFFMVKFTKSHSSSYLILSALFCALAFLTKYPNALIVPILNIFLIINYLKERNLKNIIIFNLSVILFISPFFIVNYLVSGNPLYLFNLSQNFYKDNLGHTYDLKAYPGPELILKNTPWIYINTLLLFLNVLIPFAILGIYFMLKEKSLVKEKVIFLIAPLITFFIFFQIFYLKQERYLLPIFPFIAIFAAYGLSKIKTKKLISLILLFYILIPAVILITFFIRYDEVDYQKFFINPHIEISCKEVLTSDARSAINYKVLNPYQEYNEKWTTASVLKEKPDCIFYFSCYQNRSSHIKEINNLNYNSSYLNNNGRCTYAIFKKIH
ncbi:MAG: glycosyltransferase family 39 protein [Nanoarchaeota archaeon]|nr:glycosyltransferase family 39 protein [Nanoarchaeota archaeon]